MTTDQALDKMEMLLPHFSTLFNDQDASEFIMSVRAAKCQNQTGEAMNKLIPIFARQYRETLYNIVAISHDKTVEEVRNQPIMETINCMRSSLVDETMMFFIACMRMIKNI